MKKVTKDNQRRYFICDKGDAWHITMDQAEDLTKNLGLSFKECDEKKFLAALERNEVG